jgi:cytochrome c
MMKMYRKWQVWLLTALTVSMAVAGWQCGQAGKHDDANIKRPIDAWVFRSVLDQRPRMITMALHEKLWVAYSTQTASFYKAWTGNITGKVFTDGNEQPKSTGNTYFEEPDANQWQVVANGIATPPTVQYKGHSLANGHVRIHYMLTAGSDNFEVEEEPEFFTYADSSIGFKRTFTVSGGPKDRQLVLRMNIASVKTENDIATDGQLTVLQKEIDTIGGQQLAKLIATLQFGNGRTGFSVKLADRPVLAAPVKQLSELESGAALVNKSDCNTCHNKDVKTVGPAYIDIAKKYAGGNYVGRLASKIIAGGGGNWGEVPMTQHADLSKEDAIKMVKYILSLHALPTPKKTSNKYVPVTGFDVTFTPLHAEMMPADKVVPGVAVNVYQSDERVYGFADIAAGKLPTAAGSLNALNLAQDDFGGWKENFIIQASGFLEVRKAGTISFRLVCDDGARLFVNGQQVIKNTGNFGGEAKDGEITLPVGKHPFKLDYYQRGGGRLLSLQWRQPGLTSFEVIPPQAYTHSQADIKKVQSAVASATTATHPGDKSPLDAVHPAFSLAQARPSSFTPRVGAMDFLPDGRLVVCTWDSLGAVYLLDGVQGNDPEKIQVKRIATGLAEVLGVRVVDNVIYVLQKQELTRLVDHDNDDIIDEFQVVCNGWEVSFNFHEFAFGLLYKDGYFYGTMATAIKPGGASDPNQASSRGKVIKISKKDGSFSFLASGLRTPNGIGFGIDNQIFICDNQGDWLPANKLVHLQDSAWYGSRAVDFAGTENKKATPPVVYLPQDEIANSPSQPALLNKGIYKDQLIYGDVTYGGLQRVFAEKVNGVYQGAVFMCSQGLEAGVNRLIWGPDGNLYVGGCGQKGNWAQTGKQQYGLQRLSFNGKIPFEMLAVRAKPGGLEIEFTKPLGENAGNLVASYTVQQWWYKPTAEYGGPKMDQEILQVQDILASADGKKVFLKIHGIKEGHVIYLRLNREDVRSNENEFLWATEIWYTMNSLVKN